MEKTLGFEDVFVADKGEVIFGRLEYAKQLVGEYPLEFLDKFKKLVELIGKYENLIRSKEPDINEIRMSSIEIKELEREIGLGLIYKAIVVFSDRIRVYK